jgi:predicted DNA-binding transcriptional regulator YafY
MEIACINHIRKSTDARENLLFTYEVFPDCIMERSGKREDELAKDLEDYCINGQVIEILMKSGGKLRVVPFLVVFNWYLGCWYLICRQTNDSDGEGYELLRLDRISSFEKSDRPCASRERIDSEIEMARQAVKSSFNISLEDPINVKLLFLDLSGDEHDEIRERMEGLRILNEEIRDGSNYTIEISVGGSSDFLSWIRRFGSRALILSPNELRERHMNGIKRALNRWNS